MINTVKCSKGTSKNFNSYLDINFQIECFYACLNFGTFLQKYTWWIEFLKMFFYCLVHRLILQKLVHTFLAASKLSQNHFRNFLKILFLINLLLNCICFNYFAFSFTIIYAL